MSIVFVTSDLETKPSILSVADISGRFKVLPAKGKTSVYIDTKYTSIQRRSAGMQ